MIKYFLFFLAKKKKRLDSFFKTMFIDNSFVSTGRAYGIIKEAGIFFTFNFGYYEVLIFCISGIINVSNKLFTKICRVKYHEMY
jgi:hypothetical protein